ncbi:MAG: hypothetical protein JXA66_07730, partial [Oligoflexia bacterium]|nr:hypothetical protein [Oligoflexia bacterium]
MKLPFFNNKQKAWVGPLGIVVFMLCYMVPNHLVFFKPASLPFFVFEQSIPFIDWTIWFYISDYLYIG